MIRSLLAVFITATAACGEPLHLRNVVNGQPFDKTVPSYQYIPSLDGLSSYVETASETGFNSTTTRNGPGRSGVVALRSTMIHRGQGDAMSSADYALALGEGDPAHHWLSWPAVSVGGSDIVAGVSQTYLNSLERNVKDRGNANVAAIGRVSNYHMDGPRTVEAPRGHDIIQSKGGPLDFGYQIAGRVERGLDTTRMASTGDAAVVLKEGQRVYFAGQAQGNIQDTDIGETYLTFRNGAFVFVIDGVVAGKIEK